MVVCPRWCRLDVFLLWSMLCYGIFRILVRYPVLYGPRVYHGHYVRAADNFSAIV